MKVFIEPVRCLKLQNSIGHLLAERTFKIQARQRKLRATCRRDGLMISTDANQSISPAAAGDGHLDPGPDLPAGDGVVSRSVDAAASSGCRR
jgi:hypothetical protein